MSTDNLSLFAAVQETDPRYTKGFSRSGGFKGTAVSAPWLVRRATEQFGPVGIGWGWTIDDERYQPGAEGEVIHVLRMTVWYKWRGVRGQVTHFGQTTFVGKNKHGSFTDEEAPKKSLTDALTKCLSMLGFAYDVHSGLFDDNKYVNDLRARLEEKERSEKPKRPLTEAEQKALVKPILARVKSGELTVPHAISMIQDLPGVSDAVKDAAHTKAMELAPIEEMPEF